MDTFKSILFHSPPKLRSSLSTIRSWEASDYFQIIAIIVAIYVISLILWCRKRISTFCNILFKSPKENAKECLVKSIVDGNFIQAYNIIKKYKIINDKLTSYGYTPLLVAAQYHQTQIVKFLIRNGADLNAVTSKNENAFYLAVYSRVSNMKSRDAGCIHALFHAGIDINLPNAQGYTALQLAAYCGHKTLVMWLIMKKAKVDLVPHPHLLAKSQGHYETASILNPEFYK